MNCVYQTYTTTGAKPWVIVDQAVGPFTMNVAAYIASGTATYGIEYTLDDPNLEDPNDVTVRVWPDANAPTGTTTSKISPYSAPVRAVRVNIASISGSLEFKVVQGYSIT